MSQGESQDFNMRALWQKSLKNQQGLSTHLLTHGVKASKGIPPRTSATLTEELEQDIIKDVVENLVK